MGGCTSTEPQSSPRADGSPRRRRRLKDANKRRRNDTNNSANNKNSADFSAVDSIGGARHESSGTPPPLASSSAAASSGDRTPSKGSIGAGLTSPSNARRSPGLDPRRHSSGRGGGTPISGGAARGRTPTINGDTTTTDTGSASALLKGVGSANPLSLPPSHSAGDMTSSGGDSGDRRNSGVPRIPNGETLRPLSDIILSPNVLDDDDDDGDNDGPGSDRDVRQGNNGRSMSASNVMLADIAGEVTWASEPDSSKYRQGSASSPAGPGSRKASANLRIPPLLRSSSRNE